MDKVETRNGKGGTVGVKKISGTEEAREMHERYDGHISYDALRTLPEFPKIAENPRCEACEKGKATKPPAKRVTS